MWSCLRPGNVFSPFENMFGDTLSHRSEENLFGYSRSGTFVRVLLCVKARQGREAAPGARTLDAPVCSVCGGGPKWVWGRRAALRRRPLLTKGV